MQAPQAYPQGYVEDGCEPRTKLGTVFSVRLPDFDHVVIKRRLHPP